MHDSKYKNYLLSLLLVILAFNYVDRLALGLLLQDIKVDLNLSDTQLGLLSGIAFALFYAVMGIPIARWADRGNRVTIITLTTALWSAAVALCGAAVTFLHLLLIRIGVGVGEAGCIPPAHSLIANHFDRAERPRAVARYMLGKPLAVIIGFFVAGWLNEFYGWRVTFVLLGMPGLILAVLAWLTLKEPRRARATRVDQDGESSLSSQSHGNVTPPIQPTLRKVFLALWTNRTFRNLLLGYSVLFFFNYGIWKWQPAFFIRTHGLETGELGTWFAAIWGIGGLVGTYLGGEWASRRAANDERLQLRFMTFVYMGFGVTSAMTYLTPNYYVAFGLMALAAVGVGMTGGPLFAAIQTLVPEHMRATSIAIIYLFANLIGEGLGPLMTGLLSDALRPSFGDESLRIALLALCPGYFWCAWHLWQGSQTVLQDLQNAQSESPIKITNAYRPS